MSLPLPDRAAILKLIPHQGVSCLLDSVVECDAERIVCQTASHLDADNPLRREGVLSPLALIEYGAQAMAVHASLLAQAAGGHTGARLLVSAQGVGFDCEDAALLAAPLMIHAQRKLADAGGALYGFEVFSAGRRCAWGRLGVLRA